MEDFYEFSHLIFFSLYSHYIAVTDNHVQQYGEINQLGGVFVNVMKTSLAFNQKFI